MILLRTVQFAIVALALVMLNACDGSGSRGGSARSDDATDVLTAATLGEQLVLSAGDYLELPQYRYADSERGATLAMQCRACHSFEDGGPALVGPNLFGIFGRPVGTADGYPYSPALVAADFIWTPNALDAWLAEPSRFLPGNRMVFGGLRNADDRNAVIAAVLRLTTGDTLAAGNNGRSDRSNRGKETESE